MDRKKSVVYQYGSPVLFELWKWDTKIDLSRPCITSGYKLESTFRGEVDVFLVEIPLVVHCDFGIMTEYVWDALLFGGIAW